MAGADQNESDDNARTMEKNKSALVSATVTVNGESNQSGSGNVYK